MHRILAWEEQAILELIETWGPVDRSHRKLGHRGSYTGVVFVSPSTLLRVALKHRVQLLGERFRPRLPKPAFPEISWEKNRIWRDATHFTRCKRVAYAIVESTSTSTSIPCSPERCVDLLPVEPQALPFCFVPRALPHQLAIGDLSHPVFGDLLEP